MGSMLITFIFIGSYQVILNEYSSEVSFYLPSVHKLLILTVTDERSATTMKPGNRKKIF